MKTEATVSDAAWEAMYAPYDQPTYQAVLDQLVAKDVVLDIGAGDLRLARQMSPIVQKVYAVEVNGELLNQTDPLPANLILINADARKWSFPPDSTVGVLLMRHCTCFHLYADKLRGAGATRLITNARWHMAVEVVHLSTGRLSFAETDMGWYACLCGATGFKEGPAEHWSVELDRITHEVSSCPRCIENTTSFSRRDTASGRCEPTLAPALRARRSAGEAKNPHSLESVGSRP